MTEHCTGKYQNRSGEAVIIPEFGFLATLVLVTSVGMIIIIAGRSRF